MCVPVKAWTHWFSFNLLRTCVQTGRLWREEYLIHTGNVSLTTLRKQKTSAGFSSGTLSTSPDDARIRRNLWLKPAKFPCTADVGLLDVRMCLRQSIRVSQWPRSPHRIRTDTCLDTYSVLAHKPVLCWWVSFIEHQLVHESLSQPAAHAADVLPQENMETSKRLWFGDTNTLWSYIHTTEQVDQIRPRNSTDPLFPNQTHFHVWS